MGIGLKEAVHAVRQSGGVFSDFPRAFLALRGPDRVRFLHNVMSHDIKGLEPGQARLACLLDRHGKIVFPALVHAGQEELLLELAPDDLPKALQALGHYRISDRVEFADVTSLYRVIPVHGPSAPRLLQELWPALHLPSANLSACLPPEGLGIRTLVRWDLLRLPGFHLWVDPAQFSAVLEKLQRGGKESGWVDAGPETFEVLRMEAGVPWAGSELGEGVILNELGSEEMVSFTKGCFVGQEIVARIKYRGHPPRLFRGFLLDGATPVPPGSPLTTDEGGGNRRTAGVLTSSCFSPTLNRPIALGFLQYDHPGTEFRVPAPEGRRHATLTSLPFV